MKPDADAAGAVDRSSLRFAEQLLTPISLVALDASDSRIIGWSRCHGYDPGASEIEIGWTFLARSHWGGRYHGEMKALMLRHAFQFVRRVIFVIGPQNIRSQRAVEKIGAVCAGSRRDAAGDEKLVYEITATTWRG